MRQALILILAALLTACGTNTASTTEANTNNLRVVATFSILGDLVQNVGGEHITLHTLVGPGGDAHTFDPSPADSVALVEAKLIIENGLAFEPWLDDLYSASGSQAKRIVATANVTPLPAEDEHADEDDDHDEADHDHGEYDPHVWSDVANTMRMVETIRDALVEADPEHAADYRANAERYLAELQKLDDEIVAQTNTLPPERRKLVTAHDTMRYFANRYGYEIVGTALGSLSTETADPSAGELVALVEQIKAANVPAIFAENVQSARLMERIAQEAGVKIAPTLYSDALGESDSEGATYLAMIRYNITTIVTVLK
jgi:zinc/manganese transport system substrate-binding protein